MCSSKTFRAACESDEVYRTMEVDSLTSVVYWDYDSQEIAVERCRATRNPNINFVDGMVYILLFYINWQFFFRICLMCLDLIYCEYSLLYFRKGTFTSMMMPG